MAMIIIKDASFWGDFLFKAIIHDFYVYRKAETRGIGAKFLQILAKKLLTCGDKCAIIDITCEWGFLFCALFRFERAKNGSTIREAAGTFDGRSEGA